MNHDVIDWHRLGRNGPSDGLRLLETLGRVHGVPTYGIGAFRKHDVHNLANVQSVPTLYSPELSSSKNRPLSGIEFFTFKEPDSFGIENRTLSGIELFMFKEPDSFGN